MNVKDFLKNSIGGQLSVEKQERFLREKTNIAAKELAKVVEFLMKEMPIKLELKGAIDICGTGGSGLNRINTSTISAFVLAALGVKIAKHGNKAASGRFGSFDLLEKLGIEFLDDKEKIERTFKKTNLAFLYARNFHPVMRHFAEVRAKIGKPTFFNLLGPLLNPAQTKTQIIGTTFKDKMKLIAETCRLIGKKKVYVICGEDGLDEVTLTGKTYVTELNNGKIKNYTITPEDFGVKRAKFSQIKGGSPEENVKTALDIINGRCKTRHLDLVLINSALALKLCGKAKTLKRGYIMAKKAIETGNVGKKYEQLKISNILSKIIADKKIVKKNLGKLEKSARDFYAAIKSDSKGPKVTVIAEIKPKSPSEGKLAGKKFSVERMAKNYEKFGAAAISVLCDKKYFGGDVKNLQKAKDATKNTPILCKDFIIDEYQIREARKYGADAILLIAALLSKEKIQEFADLAESLNMDVLCEVHDAEELRKVLKTTIKIIGINNRDLKTFKTDLAVTNELAKYIPKRKLIVSESGILEPEDIKKLPKNVNAVLIGTALMRGKSPKDFIEINPLTK